MSGRKIVIAASDSDESERALAWTLLHLYRTGDELNIVHVIERPAPPVEHHGAPPVDYLPQPAPTPHEQVVETAKHFLQARFGTKVQALQPPPVVHLVTSEASSDSIGSVLCRTADQLGAIAIVMARRSRSKLQELFLGSITSFCTHHSQQPVLCVH
jgi:nucleotide-binding universal stress UspA family protein